MTLLNQRSQNELASKKMRTTYTMINFKVVEAKGGLRSEERSALALTSFFPLKPFALLILVESLNWERHRSKGRSLALLVKHRKKRD